MNELRQDPVSGDWIILAPGRAARPHFLDEKKKRTPSPKATCPFENLHTSGNWPPLASYPNGKNWKIIVLNNKYPALTHDDVCSVLMSRGMYRVRSGVGIHELIVTRDHGKNFGEVDAATATGILATMQKRIASAAADPCVTYTVPFFNWGAGAGASIWHPHYQMLFLPIVPAHSDRSLRGAETYLREHHRCVRCDMIATERKEKRRVLAENKTAIAFAPYASKLPYEIRIMPKRHAPYFYKTSMGTIRDVARLLQDAMKKMKKKLNDPDMNFFLHEAPLDGKRHNYHHWHIELFPRVSIPAGFEFSTGVYINSTDPEDAVKTLNA